MSEHPTIDRDTYRKIKKMSRDELQDFLICYANNLLEDRPTINLSALQEDLGHIKGIGEKRLEEIMNVIEQHLDIL